MDVLADKAGHIRRSTGAKGLRGCKQRIQMLQGGIPPAKTVHKAAKVLRDQPGVLPGIAFAVIIAPVKSIERIERSAPASGSGAATDKAGFRIKEVSPTVAPFGEESRIFLVAKYLCGVCHGSIGNGIFHIVGASLAVKVAGDVSVFLTKVLPALIQHHGGLARSIGAIIVDAGDLFYNGIGHSYHSGITHHAIRFAAHQVPDRELALRVVDIQHRVHDIGPQFWVDDVVKRHCGAVGIPKGIGGVRKLFADVRKQRRRYHRVVEGGVEDFPGICIIGFDSYFGQGSVPFGAGLFTDGIKVPAGEFSFKCGFGSFATVGRKCHLQQDFFSSLG